MTVISVEKDFIESQNKYQVGRDFKGHLAQHFLAKAWTSVQLNKPSIDPIL